MKSYDVSIQMKASEQYFSVVLFIMRYIKVVVTFESEDEILWCEYSDESYRVAFFLCFLCTCDKFWKTLKSSDKILQ